MFRTARVPAAFAALLGVLLALLACGVTTDAAGHATAAAPVVVGAAVPGCDPGHAADEGASGPSVPPRAHGFAELLPALAADRAAGGTACPTEGAGRGPAPGREPPEPVTPSPVELSVLRV